MAIRKVVIWPHPILAAVAQPVKQVDARVKALVRDLFDTMYDANGVGLAAPQVGVGECVLVVDLNPRGRKKKRDMDELSEQGFDGPRAFINPAIIHREGTLIWEEGCLSIPGINEEVERSEIITVRATDEHGEPFEKTISGLYAVAIQHELDHLQGKVFVDYVSRLKRELVKKKMNKIQKDTDDYYRDLREEDDARGDRAAASR
jgi:peptide deformylase